MTTIIIRKNHEGIYRGFYCMGHAEYAKKRLFGKEPDILCAAISVTVQSTIMALDEMVDENAANFWNGGRDLSNVISRIPFRRTRPYF
ncbi:MAG: ribosomal-processing cysteine protease Prp [Waltera sp.]